MKKFIYTLLLLAGISFGVNAQTKKDAKPVASPKTTAAPAAKPTEKPKAAAPAESNGLTTDKAKLSEEDVARIWSEYATPGAYHEQLAAMVGVWNETIKLYMEPNGEPMVNKAVCTIEMIYDGRYQQTTHKGDFNGMAFLGTGIVGYDNAMGKFVSTWIDNMGTGLMYTVGTYDEKAGKTVYLGEQMDPVTKKMMKIREVVYHNDKGEHILEMYTTPPGGKEYLSMEIVMVKIK